MVNQAFKTNGIDVCFHYYDNNWHYIRKWEHLTTQKSLFPLSQEVKDGLSYLTDKTFEKSRSFYRTKFIVFDKIIMDRSGGEAKSPNYGKTNS